MDVEDIKKNYSDIDLNELCVHFPRIPMSDYPKLNEYSWEDCHDGSMGGGGLFLAWEMAEKMGLRKGMHILDLGCGNCASSIFLAKHYGVHVVAADLNIDPSNNCKRVEYAGVSELVNPMKIDAIDLPFEHDYFDTIFAMNSYLYFGTDNSYLPYLLKFLKRSGRICIAGPCYSHELTPDTPKDLLESESNLYHSPDWWENHFEKSGLVNVLSCQEHLKGYEFWLDMIRWRIESGDPKKDIYNDVIMLLSDKKRFITYFMLTAQKQ